MRKGGYKEEAKGGIQGNINNLCIEEAIQRRTDSQRMTGREATQGTTVALQFILVCGKRSTCNTMAAKFLLKETPLDEWSKIGEGFQGYGS